MDKLEALVHLAEDAARSVDSRRGYEWKISFGVWTVLGFITGFLLRGDSTVISQNPHNWEASVAFLVVFLVLYVFVWSRQMHIRMHRDLRSYHHYWNLVEQRVDLSPKHADPSGKKVPCFLWDWSHGIQIAFTVLLAGGDNFVDGCKRGPTPLFDV